MKLSRILLGILGIAIVPSTLHADWYWGHRPTYSDPCRSKPRPSYYHEESYFPRPQYFAPSGNNAIWYGVKSGRLSNREVWELQNKAQNIEWEERNYLSDGRLNWWEREDLRNDIHDYDKSMNHELNDGERRW